jgi:hypothetical protein
VGQTRSESNPRNGARKDSEAPEGPNSGSTEEVSSKERRFAAIKHEKNCDGEAPPGPMILLNSFRGFNRKVSPTATHMGALRARKEPSILNFGPLAFLRLLQVAAHSEPEDLEQPV